MHTLYLGAVVSTPEYLLVCAHIWPWSYNVPKLATISYQLKFFSWIQAIVDWSIDLIGYWHFSVGCLLVWQVSIWASQLERRPQPWWIRVPLYFHIQNAERCKMGSTNDHAFCWSRVLLNHPVLQTTVIFGVSQQIPHWLKAHVADLLHRGIVVRNRSLSYSFYWVIIEFSCSAVPSVTAFAFWRSFWPFLWGLPSE